MSSLERLSALDPVLLTRVGAALSLTLTDTPGFSYNFALMLFGIIALELSSTAPEQYFVMITALSGLFDLLSFFTRPPTGNVLLFLFAIIIFLLKPAIYFSGLGHLRARGGDLNWSSRGFAPQGWMPTSMGGGGQTLGSEATSPSHNVPSAPGAFPSGGYRLGGEDAVRPPQTTRDGYSAIA